jgi:hypothetical protein
VTFTKISWWPMGTTLETQSSEEVCSVIQFLCGKHFSPHQNSQLSKSGVMSTQHLRTWCREFGNGWTDIYNNHCMRYGRERSLNTGTGFGILSHIHLGHQAVWKVTNFAIVGSWNGCLWMSTHARAQFIPQQNC